ncbi:MAG: hypothetical protein ACFFD8_07860 [Candidatus Thorarchaeota archaeon]
MFKKKWLQFLFFLSLMAFSLQSSLFFSYSGNSIVAQEDPVEGWATILEMNEFPDGWTDLPTGYVDTQKWVTVLLAAGWNPANIQIIHEELHRSIVEDAVEFLIDNADANDIVFFYIATHGYWMINVIEWESWFLDSWETIASTNKLLVISSCFAGNFTNSVAGDSTPHISIGAAQGNEVSWAGLPEEGLPVIGCVMNHFLTTSLLDPTADSNGDSEVSIEEAFTQAYPLIRDYYEDTVYPAFPDAAAINGGVAPHPVIDDSYTGEFSLLIAVPNTQPSPFPFIVIPILAIAIGIVVTSGIMLYQKRR